MSDVMEHAGLRRVRDVLANAAVVDDGRGGRSEAAAAPPKPKRTPKAKAETEDGAPIEPRAFGFSVDDMNTEWALVLWGAKAVMIRERPDAPVEDRIRVLSVDAFKQWFSNRFTEHVDKDGKIKATSWADAWLKNRKRRQYSGIEFVPDPGEPKHTPGYLNLWRGFSVTPREGGTYSIFRDHLLTNVCGGDEKLFDWIFAWAAHMVQRPRERIGTALIFRGKMGSGKTKIGEVFGSLFLSHYFLVDDPRYVTGQFNAHMASCLLLQAEEAVWAGDKAAEGRLKGLVTSKFQMIEAKGIDPIRLDNFVRLIMTSNEDWVVPAGMDERRFAVFDVAPNCAQNHAYFAEMDEQLDAGGREALLHDLLRMDLSGVNLREIPKTAALLEQKLRSLTTVQSWWFERLTDGAPTRAGSSWLDDIPADTLFDDYIANAEKIGVKRKSEMTAFGIAMRKLVPGLRRVQKFIDVNPGETKRRWCWQLPPLAECRAFWDAEIKHSMGWDGQSLAEERPDNEG
ncbi:primase-helicase family protein [Terrihabitans sp. B22-R8]|uniref:primase-helicase family protein n=1 Tax=Terrihabitans sp. B22-R8 TaxID=3425128 RepID=UPI00403D0E0C